jgi:hypothetical protein
MSDVAPLLADFLPRRDAAAELEVCERTLDRWERLGKGPPITRLGRRVLYRRSSLLAWLRQREYQGPDYENEDSLPSVHSGKGEEYVS